MMKLLLITSFVLFASCAKHAPTEGDSIRQTLTANDTGHVIPIALDHVFTITLQSNPTTGYTWVLSFDPEGVITTKPKEFTSAPNPGVGVGGTSSWRMKANSVGTSTLTCKYLRPWEKGEKPARELVYTFTVR